jgi:hypothetical protein
MGHRMTRSTQRLDHGHARGRRPKPAVV